MKERDISDDEIQILGQDWKEDNTISSRKKRKIRLFLIPAIFFIIVLSGVFIWKHNGIQPEEKVSEPVSVDLEIQLQETNVHGYIEVQKETVNDVPLQIYIPHNAVPELTLTFPEETDSAVVFVTQAADVGGNNYGIVGDFVLAGEQLARGGRKEGFCAIVSQSMTIGVSTETPLLQEAIHEKGYFFRQHPLVKNSVAIDNKPKGKSIRRALAIRDGQVMMVESYERESFHDFAQALVDAGISEAIYLMGSIDISGWYRNENGELTVLGRRSERLKGENWLVWREK
jgi:hypothetical protein